MPPLYLDHIVILLPHASILNPPPWLTRKYTITPGGIHAGGQTENKLIIFADGSYVELIAFVDDDPKHRLGHRWGDKEVGIIDFALSSETNADENYRGLSGRLEKVEGAGVKYETPAAGGRKRDNGVVLRWEVTVPEVSTKRGEAPFFCHDVTSRELRVPFSKESTVHPCGAKGVAGLEIFVPKERVKGLMGAYEAILDVKNVSVDEKGGSFEVECLRYVDGKRDTVLNIREPTRKDQQKVVAERGVLLGNLQILVSGGKTIAFEVEQYSSD